MTALEKGKKWRLDVLGSAALFGILHISNHGWVLTDFSHIWVAVSYLQSYLE